MAPRVFARAPARRLAAIAALTLLGCYETARDADEPAQGDRPTTDDGDDAGTAAPCIDDTRGEELEFFVDRAGMLSFLGAIDTPGEALLVVAFDGREVRCADEGTHATVARPVADGFEVALVEVTRSCPVPVERVLLQVSRQGDVEELAREPIMDGTPCGHP